MAFSPLGLMLAISSFTCICCVPTTGLRGRGDAEMNKTCSWASGVFELMAKICKYEAH